MKMCIAIQKDENFTTIYFHLQPMHLFKTTYLLFILPETALYISTSVAHIIYVYMYVCIYIYERGRYR